MDVRNIREALTLPLLEGDEPFKLSETENFSPDDWAWLFLSMNSDYAVDFERHALLWQTNQCDPDAAINAFCEDGVNVDVIPDRDGTCRARFGLAAWVSPTLERLPRLRNGGSWFFPLMCPVAENHQRNEVSDAPFVPPPGPANPVSPYLRDVETPFCYLPTNTIPRSSSHLSGKDSWELTWVAVDCSIPPDGQMQAITQLIGYHRKHLQSFNFKTYDDADTPTLITVGTSDVFSHMRFKRSAAGNSDTNPGDLWFAICIDVLGPVVSQIDACTILLDQKHHELLDKGLAHSPLSARFMNTLPVKKDGSGGFRLKALHVLCELDNWSYTPNQIVEIIGGRKNSSGCPSSWRKDFIENIEDYIDEAKALVNGNYRWLIHAQKPSVHGT